MRRRFLAILLLWCLAGISLGQIKESPDRLVSTRYHSMLKRLGETFNFPDTEMAPKRAVVIVFIEGTNVTVLAVGPVSGNAKAYAQKIDDWRSKKGFKGLAEYSQENDCAAAIVEIKNGGFGKHEAKTTINLAELKASISSIEPKTEFALLAPGYTTLDLNNAPEYVARNGTRYWILDKPEKIPAVTATIKLQDWVVPALIAWIFLPIVGMAVCFGIGFSVARDQSRPIEERRRYYTKVVVRGTYTVLGAHGLLVLVTLPTHVLDPVSQLWFGVRFTSIGIMIVPLFAIVPLAMLPLLNKWETKLLAASPAEAGARVDVDKYIVKKGPGSTPKKNRGLIVWIVVLVVLFALAAWPLDRHNPLQPYQRGVFILIPLVNLISIPFRKAKYIEPEIVDGTRLNDRVSATLNNLVPRFGVIAPPVKIGPLIGGPYNATVSSQQLMVTPALADQFSDQELEFVIAHELSHVKLGHQRNRFLMLFAPLIVFTALTVSLFAGIGSMSVSISPGVLISPILIMFALTPIWIITQSKTSQKQEFAADKLALETTKNSGAAISALRHLAEQNTLPGFDEVVFKRTHPKIGERIERIRSLYLG